MSEVKTKVCTKCGEELPATEEYFYKHIYGKGGINSKCKNCLKKYSKKQYREKNKEEWREYWGKYRDENRDKINAIQKKYYQNKEEIREYQGKYREKNKEEIREYQGKYRDENRDKIREKDKNIIEKIGDQYVKRLIYDSTGLKSDQAPPELIELKREQIKLHRKIYSS
jgi:hypothetical protein